jgi:hypothetical protein
VNTGQIASSETGVGSSDLVAAVHPAVDRADEDISGGAGTLGVGPMNTGELVSSETGVGFSDLVAAVHPAVDRADEDISGEVGEANQVRNSCEITDVTEVYRRRDGLSGKEDSEVEKRLKMSLEVSTVTGLSCDGQEGLKEDCLRRIVVEKYEIGGGDCSGSSEFQQEEDNLVRDGGYGSDYEA